MQVALADHMAEEHLSVTQCSRDYYDTQRRYNYVTPKSYLELTLIRILLSWVSSLVCILLIPKFIAATDAEVRVFKDWFNLALKTVGSILVVASLLMLNNA